MRKVLVAILAASVMSLGIGMETLPAMAAGKTTVTAPKAAASKPKDFGGAMPLPVDQRIERANKPSDKLLVEVTKSAPEGTHYVAYVKIVWGDLDNLIKGTGSQYYSDWDGSLTIAGGTGAIDKKIQFDDGTGKPPAKAAAKPAAAKPAALKPKAAGEPGSGRDQVEITSGPVVDWKAGVVGALDGLQIKITSPTPVIQATLVAGKFTVPITIGSAASPTPESGATGKQLVKPKLGGK